MVGHGFGHNPLVMSAFDSEGRARVVAAVLRNSRGSILLTRRGDGRSFAGAWEFPGGKVEAGESPGEALARELHEELGIRIEPGDVKPFIAVPCSHGGKRIVLDVYQVPTWRGRARGREGQALAWTSPHRLAGYSTPPADVPVVAALQSSPHYPITPEPEAGDVADDCAAFLSRFEAALAAGCRRVQLRARTLGDEHLRLLAARCMARCREYRAELLINGAPRLAEELGCGVHLRAEQLMALSERPLPLDLPVAASCHGEDELAQAQRLGLDFVVLGPVQHTASHPNADPMGWQTFARLRESVSLPIYALGGLRPEDVALSRAHGAQGVAGIGAFWPAQALPSAASR